MHCDFNFNSFSAHRLRILLLLFAFPLGAQQPTSLPPKVTKLLDTQYPGWKLSAIPDNRFKACYLGAMQAEPQLGRMARTAAQLFFVAGDFDEDGRLDYAVSIVQQRRNLAIVVLDRQPMPKLIVLLEMELGESLPFLELYRKGSPRNSDAHGAIPFSRDAIGLYDCETAMNPEGMEYHPDIFIYRNGVFHREDWVPAMGAK